jgi:predicted transcriptional regulator
MAMAVNVKPIKNPILAWREIEGETVIISPEESVMHELNSTGSFIWNQIDGQRTAGEIAELLASEYEVSPETALADTRELLDQLAAKKLVATDNSESARQADDE